MSPVLTLNSGLILISCHSTIVTETIVIETGDSTLINTEVQFLYHMRVINNTVLYLEIISDEIVSDI